MITPYTLGSVTWIDVVSPTKEEIAGLIERFHIDARIGEDLLSPTPHNVVARYESALHLVLHFPALRHSHNHSEQQEIDVVITPTTVITCRYEMIDAIDELSHIAETAEISHSVSFTHTTDLAGWILSKLYTAFGNEIAAFEDTLEQLEKPMFGSKEHFVVTKLSHLSRNSIMCKKVLSAHSYVLADLVHYAERLFGFAGGAPFRTLLKTHAKLVDRLSTTHELIGGMRDTNNSLLRLRQQNTMQALTFITVIVGSLLVIFDVATLGTLEDDFIPLVAHDKVIVLAAYLVLTGIMTIIARSKRWI